VIFICAAIVTLFPMGTHSKLDHTWNYLCLSHSQCNIHH